MRSIEVFADVVCPFAYVGLRSFEARRGELGAAEPVAVVRAWPLELVNDAPHDPDHLAGEVAALRAQVAPELFAGFDAHRAPTSTLAPLAATAAAYRRSRAVGEAFAMAVRVALFEHGHDVSDPAVLAELADRLAVEPASAADRAAVAEDLAEGGRRGVTGSPHWFTPAGDFFCPSLDIRHEDGRWDIRIDRPGFDAFLGAALG